MSNLKEKQKEYSRKWRSNNPDYHKKWRNNNPNYFKKWRENNPDYQKNWHSEKPDYSKNYETKRRKKPGYKQYMKKYFIKKYGLTIEQFEKMKKDQNYSCKVCLQKEDEKNTLNVDHSHVTGLVRGLLCGKCNRALGLLLDSIHLLGRMRGYLLQTDFYPKTTAKHLKDIVKVNIKRNKGKKIIDREMLAQQNEFIKDIIKEWKKNNQTGTLEKFLN